MKLSCNLLLALVACTAVRAANVFLGGSQPVAVCQQLDPPQVCTGATATAEQVGGASYSKDGSSVALSLDSYGPWSTTGLKVLKLTAKGVDGKQDTKSCMIRVINCPTEPVRAQSTIISCPSNSSTLVLSIPPGDNQTVQLGFSSNDTLCYLTLVAPNNTLMKPVGRSYYGYPWESYAGDYASLVYNCTVGTSFCSITLPPLPADGSTFQLTSSNYAPPLPQDSTARFLEQATFGPNKNDINQFKGIATWFQQQLDLPVTSHRQYFRERTTHRFPYSTSTSLFKHPCAVGARYRNYAFTSKDYNPDIPVVIKYNNASGQFVLSMNGQARTVVNTVKGEFGDGARVPFEEGEYYVCAEVEDRHRGSFQLYKDGYGCSATMFFDGRRGNPTVTFTTKDPPTHVAVNLNGKTTAVDKPLYIIPNVQEMVVTKPLTGASCSAASITGYPAFLVVGTTGTLQSRKEYWLHTPVFDIKNNTLTSPLADGGAAAVQATNNSNVPDYARVLCSNAPRTFLNEDQCVLGSANQTCSSKELPDMLIPLEIKSLRTIYQATGGNDGPSTRYVYVLSSLRQDPQYDDPPCTPGVQSRWIPLNSCSDAASAPSVQPDTTAVFVSLFEQSNDVNSKLKDVYFPLTGAECHSSDLSTFGFKISIDSKCWLNVHPDYFQVFDMTVWTTDHPGNNEAIGFNPIKDVARNDTFVLEFPSWHPMQRWNDNKPRFGNVGRLGDQVSFKELPDNLVTDAISSAFNGYDDVSSKGGPVMVCGSPFEVANVPTSYGKSPFNGFDLATFYLRTSDDDILASQRVTVWFDLALKAADQLRQRVAWALSQILVVSPNSITSNLQTESFVTYYDIFVRHAFGSYRDILKEVSYSPLMAEMLTYLGSKSTAFVWSTQKRKENADENYAREIMQLFSIGLYELNQDGTQIVKDGSAILTYTNDQITEYARVWTGFARQGSRGNIEYMTDPTAPNNQVDPMTVNVAWRDQLPKLGLKGKFVGDGWPLCSDLPPQHFLSKGAKFRQLGASAKSEMQATFVSIESTTNVARFSLDTASALYGKLCNSLTQGGPCRYASTVELNETLSCHGEECKINTLRTFEVGQGMYYEYVRPPCVQQAFPPDLKTVKTISDERDVICADPRNDLASSTCCSSGTDGSNGSVRVDKYSGERLPFPLAASRCSSLGLQVCSFPTLTDCETNGCDPNLHYWTSVECQLKVKIDVEGKVSIVHVPDDLPVGWNTITEVVQERTVSTFRVEWGGPINDLLADFVSQCAAMGCSILQFDGLCVCDIAVEEETGFNSPPSRDEVLDELHIGAFAQSTTGQLINSGVTMYSSSGNFDINSVFEVVDDNGIQQRRKNIKSTVSVGDGRLWFRNPVHFVSLVDPEVRDAHYETDAALDHYFYHPNIAPFLAVRFAQRFGISNPSPRYVKTVGSAFRSGKYAYQGTNFGTGTYGDLSATIAAVILDREARSVVLDADPFHGSIREPLLKIMHLMRALQYATPNSFPMIRVTKNMQDFVGQGPHQLPDVFSFFKPEYQPAGPIGQAGLVAPEAQVFGPKSLNLVNTILSFIKYGVTSCYLGFGIYGQANCGISSKPSQAGNTNYSPRLLADSTEVANELATLLTSGRLSSEKRQLLAQTYESIKNSQSKNEALKSAQQLIALSPEFHTNGVVQTTGLRPGLPSPPKSDKPYKAIVYVFLEGAYDSNSMIVPETCSVTNAQGQTVREQFDAVRGELTFLEGPERSLLIDTSSSSQPCDVYALHDELTLFKELYDEKALLLFANMGLVDVSGLNKTNYQEATISTLFAHNQMQLEAQKVDPYSQAPGSGVLGRAADVLTTLGYTVNSVSIDNLYAAVRGEEGGAGPEPLTVPRTADFSFNPKPADESYFDTNHFVQVMNQQNTYQSSIFAEAWSNQLISGLNNNIQLAEYIGNASLSDVWNETTYADNADEQQLFEKFSTVAKFIQKQSDRGIDRDVFFMNFASWDHHLNTKERIREKFQALNYGLNLFVEEMKYQNMWDNVTIVITSEFARTLTPNGGSGCDHAWGGHYAMMGGAVQGGRMLGNYPTDITEDAALLIGYGRVIPTTSWDSLWNGVLEWMGVESTADLDECLPNRNNTVEPGSKLFSAQDLYV